MREFETLYTIDLRVQTFVPQPSVPFNVDLRYAVAVVEGTLTPDWKVLTTPNYMVTTSNTRDLGKKLLQGNMQPVLVATPLAVQVLFGTGATLLLIWPVLSLLRWLNRKRPGYVPSANEAAWTTFRQVIREGNQGGFEQRHFRQLSGALKGYLGVGTRTRQEISELLKHNPAISTILSALQKCDRALYAGADLLDKDELTELIAQLEEIVPKPD